MSAPSVRWPSGSLRRRPGPGDSRVGVCGRECLSGCRSQSLSRSLSRSLSLSQSPSRSRSLRRSRSFARGGGGGGEGDVSMFRSGLYRRPSRRAVVSDAGLIGSRGAAGQRSGGAGKSNKRVAQAARSTPSIRSHRRDEMGDESATGSGPISVCAQSRRGLHLVALSGGTGRAARVVSCRFVGERVRASVCRSFGQCRAAVPSPVLACAAIGCKGVLLI
jgi:hypothetical protein